MQQSDLPLKLPIRWAEHAQGGYIRGIPVASQIGSVPGAASLYDGFVPLNATPVTAGGIPPDVRDMNGILFEVSGWSRWAAAGGTVGFDADFAAAIGGYPIYAVVKAAGNNTLFWVSTVDNNLTNPDAQGAAGWAMLVPVAASGDVVRAGQDAATFVTPATLSALRASLDVAVAGADPAAYISAAVLAQLRASLADAQAGTSVAKYVSPAVLAQLFSGGPGILTIPGFGIIQLGVDYRFATVEGNYVTNLNEPFPTSLDGAVVCAIKDSGDLSTKGDIGAQWRRGSSSLSQIAWTAQGYAEDGSNPRLDGISWVAWGR